MLAAFPMQAANGLRYLAHIVSAATGDVLRSFDSPPPSEQTDPYSTIRHLDVDDNAVWTVPLNSIRIRRETIAGDTVEAWVRDDGWFPGWKSRDPGEPFLARPQPYVTALKVEPEVIWLYATVADSEWKPDQRARPLPGSTEGRRVADFDPNLLFDGVVECIDRRTGAVLARFRSDEVYRPLPGHAHLAQRSRATDLGEIVVEVVRVEPRGR